MCIPPSRMYIVVRGWDPSPLQGYPSIKFACTHLYTWVKRGTVRVKCLAQEHSTVPLQGLEPGLLDPEYIALIIRAPHLPQYRFEKD